MNLLLKEYMLSGDGAEAERCLRDLEVPHFYHEFVYEVKPASLQLDWPYWEKFREKFKNLSGWFSPSRPS